MSVKEIFFEPLRCVDIDEKDVPDMTEVIAFFESASSVANVPESAGRRYVQGFSLKTAEWVFQNWILWKDDVLIASYPKTGTTWLRHIVRHLLYKDEPDKIMEMSRKLHMFHNYLESGLPLKYKVISKLPCKQRIMVTHLPMELVNMKKMKETGAKIICTIRNPKDAAVSYYHMIKAIPRNPELTMKLCGNSWNDFFDIYTSGKFPSFLKDGEWYLDHLLGWHQHRNDSNVLFVVFEDLKKNQQREIRRIAKFLEVEVSEEKLREIVEATSFKSLSENATPGENFFKIYRKGEVGDWKNYFTVAQSELMDEKIKEKLSSTDITFTYQ